jgi:deoxyadenosine/deoxycytidine kinase
MHIQIGVNERLASNISLNTEKDNEAAAKFFNGTMQWAPGMQRRNVQTRSSHTCITDL